MKGDSGPKGVLKRDSAHGMRGYLMSVEEKGSPPGAGNGARGSAMARSVHYRLRFRFVRTDCAMVPTRQRPARRFQRPFGQQMTRSRRPRFTVRKLPGAQARGLRSRLRTYPFVIS
jgi:hypothetical protein